MTGSVLHPSRGQRSKRLPIRASFVAVPAVDNLVQARGQRTGRGHTRIKLLGDDMAAKTMTLRKLALDRAKATKLADDLLRAAVHREEWRLGRRLSKEEIGALELQTFEPILVWRVPKQLH